MVLTRRTFLQAGAMVGSATLTACGGSKEEEAPEAAVGVGGAETVGSGADAGEGDPSSGSGVLVAYFSRAGENYAGGGTEVIEVGHTKVMAGYIADALGADSYEIVPAKAYPEGYDECCDVAAKEQSEDVRPAIAAELPDVSGYAAVLVGCPIWWGDEPMVVRTFLEGVDLSGKVVVPFTTHAGSGLGRVPANLQGLVPGATHIDGLAVAGTSVDGARDEVASWARGLGIA